MVILEHNRGYIFYFFRNYEKIFIFQKIIEESEKMMKNRNRTRSRRFPTKHCPKKKIARNASAFLVFG
jgi:hypothetical protein